ncbi:medium chain reductase/dehydrogenase (MDR)/zinc-dependent alcohol dehydrogenase-like family protein [Skeletonema marinoi]|uniref:Medium chain reductase/dehydrogenase (MDR)/zinc-dependent alcohol dehydrogenase-like family protein n=1 Tax=Skeletonema marinoi TaxID=267567 RepID=A0AAD8YGM5_9STRA|nr:medium chain reductase/dehydrogenase (MDR)/zinc-dependent alcohol dehydrogenase-like family protein [Skeletonema marinoi]
MVKLSSWKRSFRISSTAFSAQQSKNTDKILASLKLQDESKEAVETTIVESPGESKQQPVKQEAQPADVKTKDATPEKGAKEGETNTETMIQALRTKLGLHDVCNEDAELTSLDEGGATSEEETEYKPDLLQHEKMVLEDLSGGLAFLTFSRFAVVDESTHILIKVRACTFSPEDAKKCSGIGLTKAMLPYVPGQFVIGTIEDVGSDVPTFFKVGDRVIGMVDGGGCSRFLSADVDNFVKAPSNLGNSTALALMQDWMPAYRALHMAKQSTKRANLFGMNLLITDSMSAAGQAVIALASEEGANIYCCAEKTYHDYLKSLSSRITCLESNPEKWLPALEEQMDVVIDNTCSDGYVSSCEALGAKGVLISLPYVSFDDNRLFGLFDMSSFQRKIDSTKAKYTMCQTVTVDTKEEFEIGNEDENTAEKRLNFVRDFQYLAVMHDKGIIQPKISEKVSLQEVSSYPDKFKSGAVGTSGGTVVCFPWKREGDVASP